MKPFCSLFFALLLYSTSPLLAHAHLLVIQPAAVHTMPAGVSTADSNTFQAHPSPISVKKPSFLGQVAAFFHPPFAKGCRTDGFGIIAFVLGFVSLVLPLVPGIIVLCLTIALGITSLIRIGQRSCRNPKSNAGGKPNLKGRGFAYVAILGALLVLGILLLGVLIL